ncbi:hypothetical protein DFH09DRAFT_1313575 [Mycena vulgaris]|nr:hypothetical protein DFH09DRAFT_1313575 [Mycena vulgaris]
MWCVFDPGFIRTTLDALSPLQDTPSRRRRPPSIASVPPPREADITEADITEVDIDHDAEYPQQVDSNPDSDADTGIQARDAAHDESTVLTMSPSPAPTPPSTYCACASFPCATSRHSSSPGQRQDRALEELCVEATSCRLSTSAGWEFLWSRIVRGEVCLILLLARLLILTHSSPAHKHEGVSSRLWLPPPVVDGDRDSRVQRERRVGL